MHTIIRGQFDVSTLRNVLRICGTSGSHYVMTLLLLI